MKNVLKALGFIALVAIIAFSMAACEDDPPGGGSNPGGSNPGGSNPGGTTPGSGSGTLTITDIPSQYNGAYAEVPKMFGGLNLSDGYIVGCQDFAIDGYFYYLIACPISNGRVSIPIWYLPSNGDLTKKKRYSGNDTSTALGIQIRKDPKTDGSSLKSAIWKRVTFSNGSLTLSWNVAETY